MSKRRHDDHPASPVRPPEDLPPAPPQVPPTQQPPLVSTPVAKFTSTASLNSTSYAFGQRVEFVGMFSSIARIFAASTVYDELFTHCAVPDPTILARIARTCRPARNAVHEFLTRQWNTQLKEVFRDPHEFRALQARLGFLVARYENKPYEWSPERFGNMSLTISATKADELELVQFLERVAKLKPVGEARAATRGCLTQLTRNLCYSQDILRPYGADEVEKLPYTVRWFGRPSDDGTMDPLQQCRLLISDPGVSAQSANLIAPFLAAPQHFDIFSWRTGWTPYPRTTHSHPDLHRGTDSVTLGWQVAVMVAKRSPAVKEMLGERWLGDATSWIIQLSTEAVEELLPANIDRAQLNDSHFALNGWSMETEKLVPTGEDDRPHFRFPRPRWDQVGPGVFEDEVNKLDRSYTVPHGFIADLKSAASFRQAGDNVDKDGILLEYIRAFQRLRRAQKIYSSPLPAASASSPSTTRTVSGSPRRKHISAAANTSPQARARGGRSVIKGRAQAKQLVDGMKTLDLTAKGESVETADSAITAEQKPAPFLLNIPV